MLSLKGEVTGQSRNLPPTSQAHSETTLYMYEDLFL